MKSTDMSFVHEDERAIKRIVKKCWLGDWFLVTQVFFTSYLIVIFCTFFFCSLACLDRCICIYVDENKMNWSIEIWIFSKACASALFFGAHTEK